MADLCPKVKVTASRLANYGSPERALIGALFAVLAPRRGCRVVELQASERVGLPGGGWTACAIWFGPDYAVRYKLPLSVSRWLDRAKLGGAVGPVAFNLPHPAPVKLTVVHPPWQWQRRFSQGELRIPVRVDQAVYEAWLNAPPGAWHHGGEHPGQPFAARCVAIETAIRDWQWRAEGRRMAKGRDGEPCLYVPEPYDARLPAAFAARAGRFCLAISVGGLEYFYALPRDAVSWLRDRSPKWQPLSFRAKLLACQAAGWDAGHLYAAEVPKTHAPTSSAKREAYAWQ